MLSCSRCNIKKSDALAREEFLEKLISRNSLYSEKYYELKKSLNDLDSGKGWEPEMRHNYEYCMGYGFSVIKVA